MWEIEGICGTWSKTISRLDKIMKKKFEIAGLSYQQVISQQRAIDFSEMLEQISKCYTCWMGYSCSKHGVVLRNITLIENDFQSESQSSRPLASPRSSIHNSYIRQPTPFAPLEINGCTPPPLQLTNINNTVRNRSMIGT